MLTIRADMDVKEWMSPMNQDRLPVVVVGGGLAGLAAAAYLARAGRPATLYEMSHALGGRAATRIEDGFAFDVGIHALYTGGAASEVLSDLGVDFSGGTPPPALALDGGSFHLLPTRPGTLDQTDLLDARDKAELGSLVDALPGIDAHAAAHQTIQAWIGDHVQRPRVRRLLTALARTYIYSAAIDLVSAEVYLDKWQRALRHPVRAIDGGWQTLVDGLRRVAVGFGARIVTGARVSHLELDAERVAGVRLQDGRMTAASAVIVATTPREARRLLKAEGEAWARLREEIDALVPAQLACLDVGLSQLPAPEQAVVQDLERPLFLAAQSLYARLAPDGGAMVRAFKQVDPRTPHDPRADERDLEALLDIAQPGWRDAVVRRVYLPRIAAVGALPLAARGGFDGRPGVAVEGVPSLYLAGDWVGRRGFLADASFASARTAAELITSMEPPRLPAASGSEHAR
jgi:phytoene dehydrogenase-like protein